MCSHHLKSLSYRIHQDEKKIQEKVYEKLKSIVGDLKVRLPFVDTVKMVPTLKQYMKDILTYKMTLEKSAMILTHECSTLLQGKLPEKREEQKVSLCHCIIGDLNFNCCLCDFDANVSLTPSAPWAVRIQPCKIFLVLEDQSIRYPVGLLENIPMKIG